MNVLLDVTALMRHNLTGIGVYTRNLWLALNALPDINVQGRWRLARFAKRGLIARHISGPTGPRIPLLSDVNLRGFHVFHGPDFRIPRWGRYPRVVTIHDMVVHEPDLVDPLFAEQGAAKLRRTLLEHRPDRIIAISKFTRDCIVARYPELAPIVDVVHPGVEIERFAGQGQAPQRPPFVLSVGSVEKRKNLATTLHAFALLHDLAPDLELVIAGGSGHGAEAIDRMIAESPRRDAIHRLGFVDDTTLAALYREAICFVFPSLYEGFGLPILEAMAAGCPVITSNIGAMAEVGGNACITVDPRNAEALARSITLLATDTDQRQRLVDAGRQRAGEFSWRACAQRTAEVYNRAQNSR